MRINNDNNMVGTYIKMYDNILFEKIIFKL